MRKITPLTCLMFFLIISCGSSNSSIVSSWKDPDTSAEKEAFQKVLVVALFKDQAARNRVEQQIASLNPIFKTPSIPLDKVALQLSPEDRANILKNEKFDGVITMRLVDVMQETDYVPGSTTVYYNAGYYGLYGGQFGGWYNYYGAQFYSPGYYVENTAYYVETNIFSLKQNKLVWSGTTKSLNVSDDLDRAVEEVTAEVVKQMKKDGFIAPTKE